MYQEDLVSFAKDHPMLTGRSHSGPVNQPGSGLESAGPGELRKASEA